MVNRLTSAEKVIQSARNRLANIRECDPSKIEYPEIAGWLAQQIVEKNWAMQQAIIAINQGIKS